MKEDEVHFGNCDRSEVIDRRYDIKVVFDVVDGNPNGDPMADNGPRRDKKGHGIISGECIRRVIRDLISYMHLAKAAGRPVDAQLVGKAIYILHDITLAAAQEEAIAEAFEAIDRSELEGMSKTAAAKRALCEIYYDVRAFGGAVGSVGSEREGQIHGPVYINAAESVDPVTPICMAITRCAATSVKKKDDGTDKENKTMGRQWRIGYGLYTVNISISAPYAAQTGYTQEDLEFFLRVLAGMLDARISASSGLMSVRSIYLFEHSNKDGSGSIYGNAYACDLKDAVRIGKLCEGEPSGFADYRIEFDPSALPEGVEGVELHDLKPLY